jgi:hypothetical protein
MEGVLSGAMLARLAFVEQGRLRAKRRGGPTGGDTAGPSSTGSRDLRRGRKGPQVLPKLDGGLVARVLGQKLSCELPRP